MNTENLDKLEKFLDFIQNDFGSFASYSESQVRELVDDAVSAGLISIHNLLVPASFFAGNDPFLDYESAFNLVANVSSGAVTILEKTIEALEVVGEIKFKNPVMVRKAGRETFVQEPDIFRDELHKVFFKSGGSVEEVFETKCRPDIVFNKLEGIPHNRLKKCLDCGKMFVQKTAREKKFCSDLCKNRYNIKLRASK